MEQTALDAKIPAPEPDNKGIVKLLYAALTRGETETIVSLLAADLEWWFHGPPRCQHMMRVLTGDSVHTDFTFDPRNITVIGDRVIVEGWEGAHVYWVHVWTLKDGVITQFREYFNTWVTVWEGRRERWTIWQSEPREHPNRSLPGLVLAV